jgi:hypothetical protein
MMNCPSKGKFHPKPHTQTISIHSNQQVFQQRVVPKLLRRKHCAMIGVNNVPVIQALSVDIVKPTNATERNPLMVDECGCQLN